jgi:peptidoglycan/xylan/chitin deacetylase (PgdA/CDA1 family)
MFQTHQRVQSLGEGLYQRYGTRGRWNHARGVDWFGTYAARAAAAFFPDVLWRVTPTAATRFGLPGAERTLYLTLDDGPTTAGTPPILEVLARFQLPVTMFVVGKEARANRSLLAECLAAGHTLANHTETHIDAWASLFPAVADELTRTDDLLEDVSGQKSRWIRPPQGHFTAKMRAWCRERAKSLVLWDVLPADFAPDVPPTATVDFVARRARAGSILVLHDNDRTLGRTPVVLEQLLPRMLDAGWKFAALPWESSL